MKTISLAFRNLSRQKKRSFLLASAVAFGFFVVTLIDGIVAGGMRNFEEQFAYLFGGNVLVERAFTGDTEGEDAVEMTLASEDEVSMEASIDSIPFPIKYINKRTIISGTVIFEGGKTTTNIFGCDFDKEKFLKEKITLVDGSWELSENPKSLIIGESIAKAMNLQIGDEVIFQTTNYSGQANFGEMILTGISKDVSLLGSMAAYCHIKYANELSGLPEDDFNAYTIMMGNIDHQDNAAQILETSIRDWNPQITNRLEAKATNPNMPYVAISRQIKDADWKGTYYTVTSLNDQIPQLAQIVNVAQVVSVGILVLLFLVVMIGISNTFKMVLYERIREIGTMRALGMKRKETGEIFAWEAVLLSIFGSLVGFIFGIIVMFAVGFINIQSPDFSLFLNNGHITFIISPVMFVAKLLIVVLLTLLAVSSSVKTASRMSPAVALRTVK